MSIRNNAGHKGEDHQYPVDTNTEQEGAHLCRATLLVCLLQISTTLHSLINLLFSEGGFSIFSMQFLLGSRGRYLVTWSALTDGI